MQIHTEIHNYTNPQQITALNQPMVIVHSPLTFEQTMALANNDRITCIELRAQQHPNFISAFGGFKKDLVALKFNYPDVTEDELRALLTFKSSGIICFGQIANASVLNALPACITELSFDLLTPQLASVLPKSVGKIIYQDVLPGALRALPNTVALVNMSRIPSSQEIYEILHAEIYTPQALLDQATAEQRNDYWKAVSSQGCLKAAHKAMQHRNFVITHAHLLRAAQIDPTNPNIFIADQALRQAQLHAVVRPSSPTLDFEGERYEDHDGSRAFFISFGDMAQGAATPRTVNVKRASEPDASSPTAQFPRFKS